MLFSRLEVEHQLNENNFRVTVYTGTNAIPHLYFIIFPKIKDYMLYRAFEGSPGSANRSAWMNSENFIHEHFIKYAKCAVKEKFT